MSNRIPPTPQSFSLVPGLASACLRKWGVRACCGEQPRWELKNYIIRLLLKHILYLLHWLGLEFQFPVIVCLSVVLWEERGEEGDNCYQSSCHITALTEWGSWELQSEIKGTDHRNSQFILKLCILVFLSSFLFCLFPSRPCRLPAWWRRLPQGSLRIHNKTLKVCVSNRGRRSG